MLVIFTSSFSAVWYKKGMQGLLPKLACSWRFCISIKQRYDLLRSGVTTGRTLPCLSLHRLPAAGKAHLAKIFGEREAGRCASPPVCPPCLRALLTTLLVSSPKLLGGWDLWSGLISRVLGSCQESSMLLVAVAHKPQKAPAASPSSFPLSWASLLMHSFSWCCSFSTALWLWYTAMYSPTGGQGSDAGAPLTDVQLSLLCPGFPLPDDVCLSRQLDEAMFQFLHHLLQVHLLLHELHKTALQPLHGRLQGPVGLPTHGIAPSSWG